VTDFIKKVLAGGLQLRMVAGSGWPKFFLLPLASAYEFSNGQSTFRSKASVPASDLALSLATSSMSCGILREGYFGQHFVF
jgi:hypothetical protein